MRELTLALVHTSGSLVPVFAALCGELIPDVTISHIVDETLLGATIAAGKCTASTAWKLACQLRSAQEAGANAVLVTCSSMGLAAEAARPFLDVPVLRVDQPMAEKAVAIGARVGVAATLATTLEPTRSLIASQARLEGKEIQIVPVLCEGAFQAFVSGDLSAHDRLVARELVRLSKEVEVVVLAQASMARVAERAAREMGGVPVLSSPRLAIEWASRILHKRVRQ